MCIERDESMCIRELNENAKNRITLDMTALLRFSVAFFVGYIDRSDCAARTSRGPANNAYVYTYVADEPLQFESKRPQRLCVHTHTCTRSHDWWMDGCA